MKRATVLFALTLLAATVAFGQTSWQKYQSNPILTATQNWESGFGVIGPRVLKVGNTYRMYYTGLGSRFQIGLAQLRRLLGFPVIQQRNDFVFHFPRGLVLAEILFQFRTIDDHLVYLLFLL